MVRPSTGSPTGRSAARSTPGGRRRSVRRSSPSVSRTPVPQPLTYLIDDVARRHGLLRVGAAGTYLRCDDPAVLDELMAGRGTSRYGCGDLLPPSWSRRRPRTCCSNAFAISAWLPRPRVGTDRGRDPTRRATHRSARCSAALRSDPPAPSDTLPRRSSARSEPLSAGRRAATREGAGPGQPRCLVPR